MNRSPASYHRKKTRLLPAIVALVVCIIAIGLVWGGFRMIAAPSPWRQSAVFIGDNTHIISWDATREHVVVFDLPNTSVIEGTRGYGKYPLGSLFKLDEIDRHGGRVYVESLSDALGIPLLGFAKLDATIPNAGSIDMVRSIFSWKSLFTLRSHQSIPWGTWASWVLAAHSLKADQVDVVTAKQVLVDQSQPDGSTISIVDAQRFDYLFGNLFIDTSIRTEGITVSVYNTTGVPTIGQHAARLLTQLGVSVVTVGNDESALTRCLLSGSAKNLRSRAGQFIRAYFHCDVKTDEDASGTSDLSLQLGTDYASIFAPRK